MNTMSEVVLIAGMAAVTFGVRYPVLALLGKVELPPLMLRALRYVPVAVLTAIIATSVLIPSENRIQIGLGNAYLVAAIIAALVSWRSKSLLLTIIIGMAAFFIWRMIFPS
jgi:branched-subunit amino acid transport protein